MPQSFWNFFIPQIQGGIDAGRTSLESGEEEFASDLFDSAADQCQRARNQTLEQIEKRNSNTYDPSEYYEHWHQPDVPDSRSVDREVCNAREREREPHWWEGEED